MPCMPRIGIRCGRDRTKHDSGARSDDQNFTHHPASFVVPPALLVAGITPRARSRFRQTTVTKECPRNKINHIAMAGREVPAAICASICRSVNSVTKNWASAVYPDISLNTSWPWPASMPLTVIIVSRTTSRRSPEGRRRLFVTLSHGTRRSSIHAACGEMRAHPPRGRRACSGDHAVEGRSKTIEVAGTVSRRGAGSQT
jgi:hypothetical protein